MNRKLLKKITTRVVIYSLIFSVIVAYLYYFPEKQIYYQLAEKPIIFMGLLFSGFLLRSISKIARASDGRDVYWPLLSSVGLILISIGFYKVFYFFKVPSVYSYTVPYIWILLKLLLILLLTTSTTTLFIYGTKIETFGFRRISEGVLDSQKKIIFLACLITSYFLYFRNKIGNQFDYPTYIDWSLIGLFSLILLSAVRSKIKERIKFDNVDIPSKKHYQTIEQHVDIELKNIESLQKKFVERGKKEYLLVYLINLLPEYISRRKISFILDSLIYYQDTPIPKRAFQWWKARVRQKNREKRKKILVKIIDDIEEEMNYDIEKFYEDRR